MSQSQPTDSYPPRAPIALLLFRPHGQGPRQHSGATLPDWYGIHPEHVAHLIAHYTRDGDTVLDLDAHPTVAAAAHYLHRRAAGSLTQGDASLGEHYGLTAQPEPKVGLVIATLPRLDVDSRDTPSLSRAIDAWRAYLRPGGFLLTLLIGGPGTDAMGHRSNVIAAARAAGLLYHQHIPVLLAPLPPTEPRTELGAVGRPPLLDGRHVRAHRDLLAFASATLEAVDA
ncbi:hypothetical protein Ade02nite_23200 [Paractinoplanes deccanensis]|uniref:Uncharacterized protein n=1 Tax=Paractinoplanes deccanensis TaxID=113561 RepID=A0ABQ3Y119_9ACTN|nr:hypothetical protein [Actinoplanes deccanensis]GID73679.1 hypothetical protein Ade02nite_23200 [Actinoplanes deccanensis]